MTVQQRKWTSKGVFDDYEDARKLKEKIKYTRHLRSKIKKRRTRRGTRFEVLVKIVKEA